MKRLVKDDESGLESLLGQTVLFLCMNYFYHGKVVAISDTDVELEEAGIVYQTGNWSDENFEDRQAIPGRVFVRLQAVESYVIK